MNDLIKITKHTIGAEEVDAVDARELWVKLESKQQFADWIKKKVIGNRFFEDSVDYIMLHNPMKAQPSTFQAPSPNRMDYALTQYTAKKVAMAEQTDAGDRVRDYFLECEKIAKEASRPSELSRMDILKLALESEEARLKAENAVKRLEKSNKRLTPKAESFDAFIDSDGLQTLREAFKVLGEKPNVFTRKLREEGVLYVLNKKNVPKQEYIGRGYFEVKSVINHKLGKSFSQTYVTPKGLGWLRKRFSDGATTTTQDLQQVAI